MRYYFLILFASLFFYSPANAAEQVKSPEGAYVTFSSSEVMQIPNDTLSVSMRIEQEGEDTKTLQAKINEMMERGLALAKKYPSVTAFTDQYYVYQYNKEQASDGKKRLPPKKVWHGGQHISLKSIFFEDVLKLCGELQNAGLIMQNMTYSLSPEKREATKDSITDAALLKLNEKGMNMAKTLNKEYGGFTWVNIDTGAYQQPGLMGSAVVAPALKTEISTPSGEPGTSEVSVIISATVLLK